MPASRGWRKRSKGDPRGLAELMASMFAEDFVLGMAPGPLVRQTKSRLGSRAWGLKSLDGLASLAEVLGVVAVENPEQGRAGLAFDAGLPGLLTAIEDELGFRIDFPNVGAASGLAIEGRLVTPDTPDQIYAALRLEQAIELHLGDDGDSGQRVVEIGGGYGSMCLWFSRRPATSTRYTIVDLPIVNVLQGYFLGRALGPDRVSCHGEPPAQIRISPDFALDRVEVPFDVLVNKDSLPEMPHETMVDYLKWGASNCRGLFYSYNQEAAMEFLGERAGSGPQGSVGARGLRARSARPGLGQGRIRRGDLRTLGHYYLDFRSAAYALRGCRGSDRRSWSIRRF